MAGFEGPRDPGSGDTGAPKLPSWAVTRKGADDEAPAPAPPADRDAFADLGPVVETPRNVRAEPPVVREPETPFDVDDPFGDNQPGGSGSPWIRPPADDSEVRVVDLADEFHLTTQQALEVCALSGTTATSGAVWLTVEQADAFRATVVTYDASPPEAEEFPSWAIPPGGRRLPRHSPLAPDNVVPGATLLARPKPNVDDEPEPRSTGRTIRIVLLVVALLAIAALVAYQLLR